MTSPPKRLSGRLVAVLNQKATQISLPAPAEIKTVATSLESFQTPDELVAFDENLLEKARTQWQFGDWESLTTITREHLEHHPDRAKIALLVLAGHSQCSDMDRSQQFARLAEEWGCSRRLVTRILISGVHDSLGRAFAASHQFHRSSRHFDLAISIGSDDFKTSLLAFARFRQQLIQLGCFDETDIKNIYAPLVVINKVRSLEVEKEQKATLADSNNFFSSSEYWENRYLKGGNSGYGSYGRLAEFKADVVNKFIQDQSIDELIEFGCGDGNQLSLIQVGQYFGVDVSDTLIDKCKARFRGDASKEFLTYAEYLKEPYKTTLSLSLDVVFHLVEDEVFERYMSTLFSASEKYCIIYSCNEDKLESDAIHVRRRKFTFWITNNLKNWKLTQIIFNKFPHDSSRNSMDTSISDFYIFTKISSESEC